MALFFPTLSKPEIGYSSQGLDGSVFSGLQTRNPTPKVLRPKACRACLKVAFAISSPQDLGTYVAHTSARMGVRCRYFRIKVYSIYVYGRMDP